MKFISLEPFVPSGKDFERAKQFFLELGFSISWDAGDIVGFERDACRFNLQKYDHKEFAENLMISVKVDNVDEFRMLALDKQLPEKFGIRISQPKQQPYGMEVNVIDMAGVCWHFIES